jgi:hypothetical protein
VSCHRSRGSWAIDKEGSARDLNDFATKQLTRIYVGHTNILLPSHRPLLARSSVLVASHDDEGGKKFEALHDPWGSKQSNPGRCCQDAKIGLFRFCNGWLPLWFGA